MNKGKVSVGMLIGIVIVILLAAGVAIKVRSNLSEKAAGSGVKIGFLVKMPEEPWFQQEWAFADQAAKKYGFELLKIGAPDGEKVLAAIDNLAAQGAGGFVICTPDVRLGPAIVAKAESHGLKLFSVDDQFVGPDGKFMDVPHMGISAREIGRTVGRGLHEEMLKRGWKAGETALCAATFDELNTARERTEGAIEALVQAGFPADRILKAPEKTTDVPGGFDAANTLLTQHGNVKKWLVCGLNDEAALGAVRAMEGRSFTAEDVIAIGIGGSTGVVDFKKEKPTGFFASVLLSPRRHGFETAEYMYKWIAQGIEPPRTTYTSGVLITRENYAAKMKEEGL